MTASDINAASGDNQIAAEATRADVLLLLHLPPPVHGSSMVGAQIRASQTISERFACRYLNLLASDRVEDAGRLQWKKLLSMFVLIGRLTRELRRRKPDICYLALTTTGYAFFRDALLVGMLRIWRVKRVFHLHNKGVRTKQKALIYKLAYSFVFDGAIVILLSDELRADVAAYVPKDKVLICPNGIPAILVDSPSSDTPVGSHASPRILFLSNLIASKGVKVLLDACAILRTRGVSFVCEFVGAEGDISSSDFQALVSARALHHVVRYLGPKYGADKHRVFRAADIFVLPTHYECFPLVVLEAMQHSLPIVSTPEGGIPDQVLDGETGFLVPQEDSTTLADKLQLLLLDQDLRRKMGEAARMRYDAQFTLEHFEARFAATLQQAILMR
jgi:glycosyltransferase involved in cell wall biosynthesis